jgi:hypothetical protein
MIPLLIGALLPTIMHERTDSVVVAGHCRQKSRDRERDRQVRVLEPLGSFCFAIGKRHIMARQSASRCRGSGAETHTQVVGVAFVVTLPLVLGYSVPPRVFRSITFALVVNIGPVP